MTKKYEEEIRELLEHMDDFPDDERAGQPDRPPRRTRTRAPIRFPRPSWRPTAAHWLLAVFGLAVLGYILSRYHSPFAPYVSLVSFLLLLAGLVLALLRRRPRVHAGPRYWRGQIIELPRRRWWRFWVRNRRPRRGRRR